MDLWKTIITILHLVICVVLMVVVLMQQGKQQGLSGALSGGSDTFFSKGKSNTLDSILKRWTSILAGLFIISSLALSAIYVLGF